MNNEHALPGALYPSLSGGGVKLPLSLAGTRASRSRSQAGAGIWAALVCLLSLFWLTPLLWMLAASLHISFPHLASFIPSRFPSLGKFQEALRYADWAVLYANTVIFTGGTLLVQLVTITLAGYAFAYCEFTGKRILFLAFLAQLLIIPAVLIVPNMITLRKLGLLNSLPGIMMPYFASAFGTFLLRQAFRGIPRDFMEAAAMDGAGRLRVLIHVLAPMVRPQLIAFSVVSLAAHWNEYIWPLMVVNSPDKQVLTIGFASFAKGAEAGADWGLVAAGALLICAPLLLLFLIFQKRFISSFGFGELK
jgi:sn-glycerol 3-phosphate transport system permease protein